MVDLIEAIGLPATLELLAEESTELAQAALKTARVLRGENPTPVTLEEARDHLAEELADVLIVSWPIHIWGDMPYRVIQWKTKKEERLKKRLEEMEDDDQA